MTYIQQKNKKTKENDPERIKWLELAGKEFKAVVTMLEAVKENILVLNEIIIIFNR